MLLLEAAAAVLLVFFLFALWENLGEVLLILGHNAVCVFLKVKGMAPPKLSG